MIRQQMKRNLAQSATINRPQNHFTNPQGKAIMNTAIDLSRAFVTPLLRVLSRNEKGTKSNVTDGKNSVRNTLQTDVADAREQSTGALAITNIVPTEAIKPSLDETRPDAGWVYTAHYENKSTREIFVPIDEMGQQSFYLATFLREGRKSNQLKEVWTLKLKEAKDAIPPALITRMENEALARGEAVEPNPIQDTPNGSHNVMGCSGRGLVCLTCQ